MAGKDEHSPDKAMHYEIESDNLDDTGRARRDEDGRIIVDKQGFETNETGLPKGYYYSPSFIGSVLAIGLGFWAGPAASAYAAPALGIINQDIGPDKNINWVVLVHPVSLSVGMTVVGRITDLFGRRWFFISGAALAAAGTLVSALAVNVPMLIVGSTIKGLAAATQLSVTYSLTELVAMKHRYVAIGAVYLFQIPGTSLAPLIVEAFIQQTPIGWRGIFYIITGVNVASGALYFFFYHPPDFADKHGNRASKMEWVKRFDYMGVFLYSAGLVLFLFGLSWGGTVFPWKSAAVICAMVLGALCLIGLALWEIYMPQREPLIPVALFKNVPWLVSAIITGIGAGIFYAGIITWPRAAQILFADGDRMYGAALSCLSSCTLTAGQMVSGFFVRPLGKQRWQLIATVSVCGVFLAATSVISPETKAMTCVFLSLALFAIGWAETVSMANTVITVKDQQQLGAAAGTAGAIRTSVAAVCSTIYTSTLDIRLKETIARNVPSALTSAGLPATSVTAFLEALQVGTAEAFAAVDGLTPAITVAGVQANKVAYSQAFRTVFLVSIAFSGCGLICAFFSPNVEKLMTGQISSTLQEREERKEVHEKTTV